MTRAAASLALAMAIALTCARLARAEEGGAEAASPAEEAEPRQVSRMDVRIEVLPSGRLRFREVIQLELRGEDAPPLSLQKWVRAVSGAPFLRQRVENVRVADSAGNPLGFRVRAYSDWRSIDLYDLPEDPSAAIQVEYEVARGLRLAGDRATLQWNLLGLVWNLPVVELEVEVILPEPATPGQISMTAELDYEEYAGAPLRVEGRSIHWRTADPIKAGQDLPWSVTFPSNGIGAENNTLRDYWHLGGLPLKLFLLLLALVPILLVVPPRAAIVFTRLYNLQALVAAVLVFLPQSWYWIVEYHYRGGELDNVLSSLFGDLALLGFIAFYVVRQDRWLAAGRREAYFLQFGLPIALALPLPMYPVNETILFLPLVGFPVALYWLRHAIAVQFGAGTNAIVEHVATEGQIPFAVLARNLKISERQLVRVLREVPALPVVANFEQRTAYSPATAALKNDLLICPGCGGATETKGADLLACGYCEREFAASRKTKPRKPVPVLVEAFAKAAELMGVAVIFWGALFAVVFLLLELTAEEPEIGAGLILSAIVLAIGGAIGGGIYRLGARFRRGGAYGFLRFLLIAGAPLIIPLLAFRKLGSKRMKLHFEAFDRKEIDKAVAERGEISFAQLAELLETSLDEAVEVARYLAGNDLIDAVFDRVGRRLVARKLYATMAREGSCTMCGGILGVVGGQVACHHCGSAAAQPTDLPPPPG